MASKSQKNKIDRRSPCPVACALDILGDRWTLLVVRDLFLRRSRFKDFLKSPENIPTNILTDRLTKLQQYKIIEKIPDPEGSKRLSYRLTKKGHDLLPLVEELRDWALKWDKSTKVLLK